MNRRRFLQAGSMAGIALTTGASVAPAWSATSLAGKGSVVVYDGGGDMGVAQRKAFFEPFQAETGIEVIPQPAVPAGIQRAAIVAGAPKFDVGLISGGALDSFAEEGLLLPIDYGWWDKADRDAFDIVPASAHNVPAMLYSLLVVHDKRQFSGAAPSTWAELWDGAKFAGKRTIGPGTLASDGGSYEIALLADGVAPDKLYPLDWYRAFKSFERLKPNLLKWYANAAESVRLFVDRQAAAGSTWNGRIDSANEQGASLGFSWNQAILQWAGWVVPRGAANVENAQKFIAYISRPEVQAKFSELITYGPTNARAFNHLSAERTAKLPTAPQYKNLQIVQNYTFWNQKDSSGQSNTKRAIVEWEKWVSNTR